MIIIYEKQNEVKQIIVIDTKTLKQEVSTLLADDTVKKISIDKKQF